MMETPEEVKKEYQEIVDGLEDLKLSILSQIKQFETLLEEKYGVVSQIRRKAKEQEEIQAIYEKCSGTEEKFNEFGLTKHKTNTPEGRREASNLFYKGKVVYVGEFAQERNNGEIRVFNGFVIYDFKNENYSLQVLEVGMTSPIIVIDDTNFDTFEKFTNYLTKERKIKIYNRDGDK